MSSRNTPVSNKLPHSVGKAKTPRKLVTSSNTASDKILHSANQLNNGFRRQNVADYSGPGPSHPCKTPEFVKSKSAVSFSPATPMSVNSAKAGGSIKGTLHKASSMKSLSTAMSTMSTPNQRSTKSGLTFATTECSRLTSVEATSNQRRPHKSTHNHSMGNVSTLSETKTNYEGDGSSSGELSNLTVAVRVRPMNTKELLAPAITNIVTVDGKEVVVQAGSTADHSAGVHHRFHYDQAFWSCNSEHANYSGQTEVFETIALPLLEKAFEGYNICLFAYGQTSSGKSYSMMGIDSDHADPTDAHSEAGIIPRFCHKLFEWIEADKDTMEAKVELSYFEIYNEKIHDLLALTTATPASQQQCQVTQTPQKKTLRVREHAHLGPYVVDLSTHAVNSHSAIRNWFALGNSQRATAATGMNDKSSRSHSIFNIVLNITEKGDGSGGGDPGSGQTRRSKISLVDLAGSERVSYTGASGERLKEGVSINKSLLTLGKVISALASSVGKKTFVPYRESVLTWLLRENLGGNSRTVMLATISPANIHLDETLATLRYACQARSIINRVKVNEDPHDKIIRELRMEVDRLQALQQEYDRQNHRQSLEPRKIIIEAAANDAEVEALRDQLVESKEQLAKAQRSWMDRLREAESVRRNEMQMLKKKGLALEFSGEQKQACLINLTADPILSGTLLYLIPKGKVHVGRHKAAAYNVPDIVLEGPLIAHNHCTIEHVDNRLFIIPVDAEGETFVNGNLIQSRVQLFDGDRLVIGGTHYFRISNPKCVRKQVTATNTACPIDFQLAHQEILAQQERKLRDELEAAMEQIQITQKERERHLADQVDALELERVRMKCTKEQLETELEIYKRQMNGGGGGGTTKSRRASVSPECGGGGVGGYKSTLLDDIQLMLARPTKECLHQIQLKVKEATQRCRDLGTTYEFRQTQKADTTLGLFHAMVNVIDRERGRVAEWPPARLDVWLDIMRESERPDCEKMFECVCTEWRSFTELDGDDGMLLLMNDSLNSSSKISLNLSAMKERLLGRSPRSPSVMVQQQQQQQRESSQSSPLKQRLDQVKRPLHFEAENEAQSKRRSDCAAIELRDLQRGAHRLRKLVNGGEVARDEVQRRAMMAALEKVDNQLVVLRNIMEVGEIGRPVSPRKTPKSVRFLLE